jgi:hypothetical protein
VPPPRASSSGAFSRAPAGEVRGGLVCGNATETADVDGLQFSSADESVARGPADAESTGGFFDGEENQGRVFGGGEGEGGGFVHGSLL